jgi:hypothetical protein
MKKTYGPEGNATESWVAAMPCGKVGGTVLAGRFASVAIDNRVNEALSRDVLAVLDWAVNVCGELAVWIAGAFDFGVGHSGRRDGGGAKSESDDRAGVHVEDLKVVPVLF